MIRPVSNPPNPWQSHHVDWLGEPPPAKLEVFEEHAKTIVSENESPDVGFRWSVNPYRGCFHACAYCYARPYHQYLDMGAGTDFERKIVVKVNAPELLRAHLMKKSWKGDPIAFCGITDCYQPLEASYEVTKGCLKVCNEFNNPLGVITKGILIRRDVDLLAALARKNLVSVFFSIPITDPKISRLVEPNVASPQQRFETMKVLSDAGVPVGISMAPLVPGLNESDMPELLERAKEAGAQYAFFTLVRLAREVRPVFEERILEAFPDRAKKIFSGIRAMKDGKMNISEFGERMHGTGVRWEAVEQLFQAHCRRLGFNQPKPERPRAKFQRPGDQGELF
ncbi:MAG: PA0069 family radical SAM protein [Bdellovibrionota bacterium]